MNEIDAILPVTGQCVIKMILWTCFKVKQLEITRCQFRRLSGDL